jgi:PAS domain S-box-containing protein
MHADENAPAMLWTARPDLRCEWVSTGWLDFTGISREEALGDAGEEGRARAVHPEDLARWLDTLVRAFDAREPYEIEYRLRRRDGEYRWVLERGRPRHARDGLYLGYSGACMDVDDRRRERDELARSLERERRARVAADEACRLREGFLASMLRELAAPTQATAAWAEHLRHALPEGGDAQRAAGSIAEYARAQERVVGALLELTCTQRQHARSVDQPLLEGVRVLVVEHDAEARDALLRVLAVAGAETRAAASAAEALQSLNAWRPDVLLTDLEGRRQDEADYSLIRALRALPAERGGCLRAAALTSEDAPPRQAVAAWYDAQLAKPVEPVALLATVARLAQPVSVERTM